MSGLCAMGLDEPVEEDVSGADNGNQWTALNQHQDHCKNLIGQSQLLVVTVEYCTGEPGSKKNQKFTKEPNLVPNVSLLGQQLNILQSTSDQYSILHYSDSPKRSEDPNIPEMEVEKAAVSEAHLLLFKNEMDEESKNTVMSLPKINSSECFLPNNVLIAPLPETVVNIDLTNDMVKDSLSAVASQEMVDVPAVNLAETECTQELNNLDKSGDDWDSDSSSDDQIRQVIVDKPVTCRALASLPANFLSIDKINGSVDDSCLGVFARKDIPKRTQFGPVEGVLLNEKNNFVSAILPNVELLVEKESGKMARLDVSNEHLSNWMRYVRPATNAEEQNLIISQHGKLLYYTTTRVIRAQEELKVWYSVTYASSRGLPLLFSDLKRNTDSVVSLEEHADYKSCKVQFSNQKMLKKVNSDLGNNNVPKYNLRNYQDVYKHTQTRTKMSSLLKERKWRCSYCQRCFSNPTLMNLHTLTHAADDLNSTGKIDIHCSQCSQEDDKDKIEQENKPLNCSVCSKRFYTNSALLCHTKTHKDDRKFECPICNQVFDKVLGLKSHVHSHSTNGFYSCSHCSKKYVEYKLIRKHIRTFHCGRKHKCINCSKRFPTLDKLRIHELSHSEHRQFLCANCGKQFKRKDKLSEHMRKIHYPDKEKLTASSRQKRPKNFIPKVLGNISGYTQFIYKCHICIVGFKRRGMLVNHLANRHPDISPDSVPELNLPILKATKDYYCQYCDKIYKSSSKRKAHILKNHPGAELPLNNKQISTVNGLQGQENGTYSQTVGSVTTNPQGCQWCHKQYASKAKLLQHQRNKHSNLLPKTLQKPKKSMPIDSGGKLFSECDSENVTEGDLILQGTLNSNTSEFEVKENDNPCFTEGEFIIDAPTLKKALRDEVITAECLPESIVELGQLIADSRPDQFFKVIQTPSGITYAQPIEIWDPLSSCQSISPSDLDSAPFLTPYTGR